MGAGDGVPALLRGQRAAPRPRHHPPGDRAKKAEDAQRARYRRHPADGERGYVTVAFGAAAGLPGLEHVFGAHNPVWQFGPSDDGVRALPAYGREVAPEPGELRRDFAGPGHSTRFLGDLYQDLSESGPQAVRPAPDARVRGGVHPRPHTGAGRL